MTRRKDPRTKERGELAQRWRKRRVAPRKTKAMPAESSRQREATAAEVANGLRVLFEATGDPLFSDVLAALASYGADVDGLRVAASKAEDVLFPSERDRLVHAMTTYMLLWESRSEPSSNNRAAEHVAADTGLYAPTYESAVDRLRKLCGTSDRNIFSDVQDLGEVGMVWATPLQEYADALPMPGHGPARLPREGAAVRWSNYWRRVWKDGAMAVRWLGA